jgi:hypothetical protein
MIFHSQTNGLHVTFTLLPLREYRPEFAYPVFHLAADAKNYLCVNRETMQPSCRADRVEWDNEEAYVRCGQFHTNDKQICSWEDHLFGHQVAGLDPLSLAVHLHALNTASSSAE